MTTTPSVDDSAPDIIGLDPGIIRRIRQTVACRDADALPRVPGAGEIFDMDGTTVQRMFNGVLIEEGCYFGELITPIITRLGGVHEPQEEVVVQAILERLRGEHESGLLDAPFAVELGSFWSYYSLWFCSTLSTGRAIGMEPDPSYLEVGKRNAALNGLAERITFVPGGIGESAGGTFAFQAESDGVVRDVNAYDLRALLNLEGRERADVLYCDIQGYETPLLEHIADDLRAGVVRFVVMSTHHQSISGDALTHQKALARLVELGAHVIAEHSVSESSSGDGLIAVSFDPADRDLVVPVSHARARDSLFGEVEYDVEAQQVAAGHERAARVHLEADVARLTGEVAELRERLANQRAKARQLRMRLDRSRDEVTRLRASTTWRIGRIVTAPAGRLRGR